MDSVAHCILIYPVSSHMLHMLPTSPHTQDHAKVIRKGSGHLGNIPIWSDSAILTWGGRITFTY